jgi:hypothetical protein
VDQLDRTAGACVSATLALVMLLHAPVEIVGVTDVQAAVDTSEDIEGEIHFFLIGETALRLRPAAYAQGERFF